jgi:hypothetical protein
MQYQEMTFCKKDVMSVCVAPNKAQQERCQFYEGSSYSERCMYFVLEEFCDCLKAQLSTEFKAYA